LFHFSFDQNTPTLGFTKKLSGRTSSSSGDDNLVSLAKATVSTGFVSTTKKRTGRLRMYLGSHFSVLTARDLSLLSQRALTQTLLRAKHGFSF
jgi:hypothetical protein